MGYEIRFESQKARDVASITFCTTGIVFQKLRTNPELLDVSHIILDEVHKIDITELPLRCKILRVRLHILTQKSIFPRKKKSYFYKKERENSS